ncbi:MAG TPA: carboxyltransferase domain-containing protein, partial [Rariglobus sp.]
MQLIPLGDCAVLAVVKAKNSTAALDAVAQLARSLNHAPLPGVTDIVPSFTTVTVHYDPAQVPAGDGAPG